jgi:DNA-binding response OmpR family regulator
VNALPPAPAIAAAGPLARVFHGASPDMSVLVIEDDGNVRGRVRQILKEEGFIVDAFADAKAALRHLKRCPPPTLILLDLGLPEIDGAQFRKKQLRDPKLEAIPVIVVSGHPDVREQAARLGASDYLAKPFTCEELLHVVQNRAVTLPRMEHFLRGAMWHASHH